MSASGSLLKLTPDVLFDCNGNYVLARLSGLPGANPDIEHGEASLPCPG